MPWKDLATKDRSMVIAAWLQASATIGMFLVALIGIWQVTPIITYQIQQQAEAARTPLAPTTTTLPTKDTVTARFVTEAFSWWSAQVSSYRRIIELTAAPTAKAAKVSYQLVSGGGQEVVAGLRPDLLVVTATGPAGEREIVSVPVNENAMTPSQFLQCKINQGYFAELAMPQRQRVEVAASRYLHEYMLPKAPAAFIRANMSLQQVHDEVSLHQHEREKALEHIQALQSVLEKASSAE
jgi:hypothetical protein